MMPRHGLTDCIVFVSLVFFSEAAIAGDRDTVGISNRIGFGLEKGIVIPLHAQGDFTGLGLGLLGRIEYLPSPRLALSANPGFLFRFPEWLPEFHGGGTGSNSTEILLAGGIKHLVASALDVHAQTGLNIRTLWASSSVTYGRITFLLGGGYRISRSWSLGANLFFPNLLLRKTGEEIETHLLLSVTHGFL